MSEFAISALKAKRAEISGLILDLDKKAADLRSKLVHIDACLLIFGWNEPPTSIHPKRPSTDRLFGRNELPRLIFDLLRQHPDGMTAGQLFEAICAQKGWDASSGPFRNAMVHKVGTKLSRFRDRGQLVSEKRDHINVWRMAS